LHTLSEGRDSLIDRVGLSFSFKTEVRSSPVRP